MEYKNTETKLETLVTYFNEERINLNPVFQRGSVWNLKTRQELVKNIVQRRPIPAVFLYKDDDGSKYTFNILDGKQRLESLLMFIGARRSDLSIKNWSHYIHDKDLRAEVDFTVDLGDGKQVALTDLDDSTIRNLREYPIPTIEIALNENTSLDEIISLFVDINQYGVKVTRLQIVRALKREDRFLNDVYQLIAEKQRRRQAVYARRKKTPYPRVLKHLQVVSKIRQANEQAERMWERLFELALFVRSNGTHRKPAEILKSFINTPAESQKKLTKQERSKLSRVFEFLADAYKKTELVETRFATDQTHFYTMTTALLASDLLDRVPADELADLLTEFGLALDGEVAKNKKFSQELRVYKDLSAKQTSDPSRRRERQSTFIRAIDLLAADKLANS